MTEGEDAYGQPSLPFDGNFGNVLQKKNTEKCEFFGAHAQTPFFNSPYAVRESTVAQ